MMLNAPFAQQLLKSNDTDASLLQVGDSGVVEASGLDFADIFELSREGSSIGLSNVSAGTESEIKRSQMTEPHTLDSPESEKDMEETSFDFRHVTAEQAPQKKSQGESRGDLIIQKENLKPLPGTTPNHPYFEPSGSPSSQVSATRHLKTGYPDVISNATRQFPEQKIETNSGVRILSAAAGSYLNKAVLRGDASLEVSSARQLDTGFQGVGDQDHLQSDGIEPALLANEKIKPDLMEVEYNRIVANENTKSMGNGFTSQQTVGLQLSGFVEQISETKIPALEQRYHQQASLLRSPDEDVTDEILKPGYLHDQAAHEFEERTKSRAIEPAISQHSNDAKVLPIAASERLGSLITPMEKSVRHFEMNRGFSTIEPESVQGDTSEEQHKIADIRGPTSIAMPTFGNLSPYAEVASGNVSTGRINERELIASEDLAPFSQAELKSSMGQTSSLAVPVLNAERAIVIVRNALDEMVKNKKREIELQLHPKELGKLRFVMSGGEGQMLVQVFAERPETLEALRRHGDILAREFSFEGFDTASFNFSQDTSNRRDIMPSSKGEDVALEPSQPDLEISRYEWHKSDARLDVRI